MKTVSERFTRVCRFVAFRSLALGASAFNRSSKKAMQLAEASLQSWKDHCWVPIEPLEN